MDEKRVLEAIKEITNRGKVAEVRKTPRGRIIVFEVSRKEKLSIDTDSEAGCVTV